MSQESEWWRHAVTYQIYPRSFADGNGDGIGDLDGLTSRIPYLAALGIDAVWLSPFYPSNLADGGYDVIDPRDVDPRIGTLEQFDDAVAALHEAGIRVIVDVVPNHTSDEHRWFQEALDALPGSAARARYIFRDGRGADGALPPNEWPSHFGPTCWTRVADGQWYLHLFAPEQPDLDWTNPEVRTDALETLRFWGDRGVDGFRVDVAHGLAKDLREPYPVISSFDNDLIPLDGSHPLFDRDEVHEIFAEWRGVFNEYDPPLTAIAESWAPAARRHRYATPAGLGQTFNFDLLTANWDADELTAVIRGNLDLAARSGSSSSWVLSNHDVVRHASRYGLPAGTDLAAWLMTGGRAPREDRALGTRRARAATLLMLALPGAAYLYQGEELGLPEVADLPGHALQDPIAARSGGSLKGRDGCRVPLPWTATGPSFGFGSGSAHLPQPAWFGELAVSAQDRDPDSMLTFYRAALAARRLHPADAGLEWLPSEPGVIAFRRGPDLTCVVNLGSTEVALPSGHIIVANAPVTAGRLAPDQAVWLTGAPDAT